MGQLSLDQSEDATVLFVPGEVEDEAVQMVDEVAVEEMEAEDSGGHDMKVAEIEGNIPDTKRTDTEQSRGIAIDLEKDTEILGITLNISDHSQDILLTILTTRLNTFLLLLRPLATTRGSP